MRKAKQKNSVKKINRLTVKELCDKLDVYDGQKDSKFYRELINEYNDRMLTVETK